MIQVPMGKIIFVMVLLFATLTLTFFLVRRWRVRRKEKQLEKLKKEFKERSGLNLDESSERDAEVLEEIVGKIEETAGRGDDTVDISLEEGYELGLETPDVIALRTPRGTLHKSFRELRFEKIEKTEEGTQITLKEG